MGKDKQTPITIDNVEYIYEELTQEQQLTINHISDLDRKINSTTFNLDQLNVGKQAFLNILRESLAKEK